LRGAIALLIGCIAVLCGLRGAAAQDAAAVAAPNPAFAEVLTLLAARKHGHVPFTEVQNLSVLKAPLNSSGELLYEAPDRLEKRTLVPRAETLVLEHGELSAQRGHHHYVVALSDAPQVAPFVESVRATLAGDRASLERYFETDFAGDVAHWQLTLIPRDAATARSVREVRIEGARDAIKTVAIRQTDGDGSLLTIGPEISP
jgi:Outer membrane lipoprotein carrier protein LolA-like